MDDDVGVCDLTGQTHTEHAAHKGMIGGCHVLITEDMSLTGWGGPDVGFHPATGSPHSQAAQHHQHLQI